VENPIFPRETACGLRKLTINHLVATKLAEQARALPLGLKHPNQLLAAMRRAAPYLHHARLLPLMEELFRWTQPQDWAPDCEPIVWPSNDDLAHALGCSERHVSRLIATAIEARLIVPRDGSDRKRRGFRQDGRIVWAWGFNLRPMAARYSEFRQAAEEGERARQECQAVRRNASILRQSIAQMLDLAQRHGLPTTTLADHYDRALQTCAALRRGTDPAALASRLASLQSVTAAARSALNRLVKDAEMSGSGDPDVQPIIPTSTPTDPEGCIVVSRKAVVGSPALLLAEDNSSLSPCELTRLTPKLRIHLRSDRPNWTEVSDAASALVQHLGISRSLYGEACRRLGRRQAAIAIAIISAKPDDFFHSAGAGGYLRGMLRRAEQGELHLDRSIFGLRETFGQRQKPLPFKSTMGCRELTAVNSRHRPFESWREMRYDATRASVAASASGTHG
jgi:replication initiation protein RepC